MFGYGAAEPVGEVRQAGLLTIAQRIAFRRAHDANDGFTHS
jgi:hypothetical protein